MDHFHHRDGRLWCEEVPLQALADEVGTPLYVYSRRTFCEHLRRLRAAFRGADPLVCYAVKANANAALLRLAHEEGSGFDIVSAGELRRVLSVGAPAAGVVFSGVGKTVREMEEALAAGILMFNVESEEELEALGRVASAAGRTAPVALRVNPDVDPRTHRYIATGRRATKFGVDLERAEALAGRALAHPRLLLRGLQCHIGSQITEVQPYVDAVARTADLARRLAPRAPALRYLNMGGGFGIYYQDAHVPELVEYARAVVPLLEGTGLRLVMEPGRLVVGNAGVLLTRVLYNKVAGDRRFVIVDAGMNDLIRPTLYGAYHRIWPVEGAPPPALGEEPDLPPCDVVGPVCETGDYLAEDRPFPEVRADQVLAVMSVGAYGYAMAGNYNERPRPAEVLVDGDRYGIVRERETYEDLRRRDRPEPSWRRAGEGSGS